MESIEIRPLIKINDLQLQVGKRGQPPKNYLKPYVIESLKKLPSRAGTAVMVHEKFIEMFNNQQAGFKTISRPTIRRLLQELSKERMVNAELIWDNHEPVNEGKSKLLKRLFLYRLNLENVSE